jgi:hypothetical protein
MVNLFSTNIVIAFIVGLAFMSGLNIITNFNDLLNCSNLNSNTRHGILRDAALFHLLVLFTIGDVAIFTKMQSTFTNLRKTKIKKYAFAYVCTNASIICHSILLYITTNSFLHSCKNVQIMVMLLTFISLISQVMVSSFLVQTNSKTRAFKTIYFVSKNWFILNMLFLICSLLLFSNNISLEIKLPIKADLLWTILLVLRSILDMICCKKFYIKIISNAFNSKYNLIKNINS